MQCPFCGGADSKVLDSRQDAEGHSIRRRRECLSCSKRWRTNERVEDEMPLVVKKNGTYQAYDHQKILNSIQIACGKRPVSPAQIEQNLAHIEWSLLEGGAKQITSLELGKMVMTALRSLDEIAYIRYASVYRRFKDVTEMKAEIESLGSPSAHQIQSS